MIDDVILVLEIFSVAHVILVKRGFSYINVRKISLTWAHLAPLSDLGDYIFAKIFHACSRLGP